MLPIAHIVPIAKPPPKMQKRKIILFWNCSYYIKNKWNDKEIHELPRKKSKVDDPVEVSNCALANDTFVPGMLTLLALLRKFEADELFITNRESKIFHYNKTKYRREVPCFTFEISTASHVFWTLKEEAGGGGVTF